MNISAFTIARCPIFFMGSPKLTPASPFSTTNAVIPREREPGSTVAKTT
jgi:hypothetical protein